MLSRSIPKVKLLPSLSLVLYPSDLPASLTFAANELRSKSNYHVSASSSFHTTCKNYVPSNLLLTLQRPLPLKLIHNFNISKPFFARDLRGRSSLATDYLDLKRSLSSSQVASAATSAATIPFAPLTSSTAHSSFGLFEMVFEPAEELWSRIEPSIMHKEQEVKISPEMSSTNTLSKFQSDSETKKHAQTLNRELQAQSSVYNEIQPVADNIRKILDSTQSQLRSCSHYYFDQKGKNFRPLVILLMAKACSLVKPESKAAQRHFESSAHQSNGFILDTQRQIAMIAEMIHTASLVHDDVIDEAATRRNKPSVNAKFGDVQSIYAGDYILAMASLELAKLGNADVVSILSKVIDELVRGELLQLRADSNHDERFSNYLTKTFMKTASLLARSCQAVAVLGGHNHEIQRLAFSFGSHSGIAFQLVDDVLDFVSSSEVMGKPTAADLKLGLATAPVLFASQQYPELHPMILRRFSHSGDVEKAWNLVAKSEGIERSRALAEQYCQKAKDLIMQLPASLERSALVEITNQVLSRKA